MNKDYRFSSYSIVVPLDSEPENVFMMHGYTGAIDVLGKEIAEYLQNHESFNKEELPCSETTAAALEKRGYITLWSKEEEVEYAKRLANALYRKENILSNSFTVVVTYDCNFRCPYCFENGIERDKTTFTEEMITNLYNVILKLAPERRLRNNIITLFGGEPLLKENKESVARIVEKGNNLGFKFTASTNGYDLEYFEDLLSPDKIFSILVTVDGMHDEHNKRRIHHLGIPTFDKIIDNIGMALNKGISVSVRINTDKNNIQDLQKLQRLFNELGYINNEKFSINSALLHNEQSNSTQLYDYLEIKEQIKQIEKFSNIGICGDHGMYQRITSAIKHNQPLNLHASSCSSQTKSFVFDPKGYIYPCLEVGNKLKHCLGSYKNGTLVWNNEICKRWRRCLIKESECICCKYAFICSGGCPAHDKSADKQCVKTKELIHYSVNRAYVSLNKIINN